MQATQAARDQFGCATLNGAELENDGGSGTAGSHWEERVFLGELMVRFCVNRERWEAIHDSLEGFKPIMLGYPDHVF